MFVNCVCFGFFFQFTSLCVFVSLFQFICLCLFHANFYVCFMRFFVFVSCEFQMIIDINNAENLAK